MAHLRPRFTNGRSATLYALASGNRVVTEARLLHLHPLVFLNVYNILEHMLSEDPQKKTRRRLPV